MAGSKTDAENKSGLKDLLIFGIGSFVIFAIIAGIFNGAMMKISDAGAIFGLFGALILVFSAPVIALVVSYVQGGKASSRKDALIAGGVTGGVGQLVLWLITIGIMVAMAPSDGGNGGTSGLTTSFEDYVPFLLMAVSSAIIGAVGGFLRHRLESSGTPAGQAAGTSTGSEFGAGWSPGGSKEESQRTQQDQEWQPQREQRGGRTEEPSTRQQQREPQRAGTQREEPSREEPTREEPSTTRAGTTREQQREPQMGEQREERAGGTGLGQQEPTTQQRGREEQTQQYEEPDWEEETTTSEMETEPEPEPEPEPEEEKENICPDCGSEMRYIDQYERWYCDSCQEYK